MSIKLSIIVPTYRRNESLPRLLDALSKQTLSSIEVIVVDQNPDDSDPDWLIGFRDALSLRRILLDQPNASTARNIGYHQSSGEVLLFIDDDLVPTPEFCARGIEILEEHPATVKCLCPIIVVDGQDTGHGHIIPESRLDATTLVRLKNSITAAVFFTREYFQKSGGFDELLFRYARSAEDQELFLRMTMKGMTYWLDQSLRIDHDETVAGGCELRTNPYWNSRERCIKAWVLRHRIHGNKRGQLSLSDLVVLSRSAWLNRGVIAGGVQRIIKNVRLLLAAIRESRDVIQPYLDSYSSVETINHLSRTADSGLVPADDRQ
jgi:glycosyltransferase involved in cell wall biosynthesis